MNPDVRKSGRPELAEISGLVTLAIALAAVALAALVAPRLAAADWPPFGRAVSAAPDGQTHPAIAGDGAGGAIVTWQDNHDNTSNIFAGHVLASGEVDAAWPVNGRALLTDLASVVKNGQVFPSIVPDGAGGAIVSWEDVRDDLTDLNVFAQHVLASGAVDPAWPANGTALCFIQGVQDEHVMIADGAGGAIVAWTDRRPGASASDIYAQHVLASGLVDPLWPVNGRALATAAGVQELPAIVSDGAGGAIVAWDDGRSGTTGLDVYAQHVLASGAVDPAWPPDGRVLCAASGDQGRATITADGAHGAIVAWSDSRVVGTSHIFAQHVLGTGAVDPAWPVDGRAFSDVGLLDTRPLAVTDGEGGAIVTWQSFTAHLNIYAQHVTATGLLDPAWPVGGRALSDRARNQINATIVSDDAGGAVVAWQDSFDIVAQHVLASGALDPTYPDSGLAVCYLPSDQGAPEMVSTGAGGAIVTWVDTRNRLLTGADIFALQVLAAGTADVPESSGPSFTFARPSPNPARGTLTLRFALAREAPVRLAIYDASGRRVRELVSGPRSAGEHAVAWDLRDERGAAVDVGMYFARLEVEGRTLIRKLTRLQ